ncbi:MAG: hypothetical protein HQL95_03005 [Magnetococcales bacterium]|nr:hypothetical protein [Magnetococcales bacterium]
MRKKRVSVVLISFIVIVAAAHWISAWYDIVIAINKINNILGILSSVVYLVPLWLLFVVRARPIRLLLLLYGVVLLVVLPVVVLGTFMVHGDLDNGWRLVHRQPMDHETFLGIYRTPDLGAMGGDTLAAARVTPLLPGVERREVFSVDLIREFHGANDAPLRILWQGRQWTLPTPGELYADGGK